MAQLSTLSAELILLIADHLDGKCLIDFSHVDRRHYTLVGPVRYKREVAAKTPGLLCWAARHDRSSVIRKLISYGIDVNLEDKSGVRPPSVKTTGSSSGISSPLRTSAIPGSPPGTFRFSPVHVLEHEDDLDSHSADSGGAEPVIRWTALHLAAAYGNTKIVDLLLDNGADIEQEAYGLCSCGRQSERYRYHSLFPIPKPSWTALHIAICQGRDATARRLVDRGALLEVMQCSQGPTLLPRIDPPISPMPRVTGDGSGSESGPDSPSHSSQPALEDNREASSGDQSLSQPLFTAMHYAAAFGSIAILELLYEIMPHALDEPDSSGQTPLAYAFRVGRIDDAVAYLAGKGADIDCMVDDESSPLIFASNRHRFGDVAKLARLGANVRQRHAEQTALHICCGGRVEGLLFLRADGTVWEGRAVIEDPESELVMGHSRAYGLEMPGFGALEDFDPDRSLARPTQSRGLNTELPRMEAVQALLEAGAIVDARDGMDRTPLMNAVEHATLPVVQLLLDAGADPSATARIGNADLHAPRISTLYAPHSLSVLTTFMRAEGEQLDGGGHDVDIFRALVRAGADVNYQDDRGHTVLHYLAMLLARASSGYDRRGLLERSVDNMKTLVASDQIDYTLRDIEGKLAIEYAIMEAASSISEILPIDEVKGAFTSADLIRIRDSIIHSKLAEYHMERTMQALDYLHRIDSRFVYDRPDTLFQTINVGFEDLALKLLERGADPSYISLAGENLLSFACRRRMGVLAETFLRNGMPMDSVPGNKSSPLSVYIDSVLKMALGGPVDWNKHPIIMSLVEKGADPHRRVVSSVERQRHYFQWHECPLDRIISRGDHDLAMAILRRCPPARASIETCSYLHRACSFSYKDADLVFVEYLVSLGLDVNGKTVHGRTVLSEIVDSITPRSPWASPFHRAPHAAENLDPETTKFLLGSGEYAPLARTGLFMECIRLLERHGADWTMESAVLTPEAQGGARATTTTMTTPAEELKRQLEYTGPDPVSQQGLAYIRSQLIDPDWDPARLRRGESPFKPKSEEISSPGGFMIAGINICN